VLEQDEVIVSVSLPFTRENEYFEGFKQARRREDDIAIVTAAMRVLLEPTASGSLVVKELGIGLGGVDKVTKPAGHTERVLQGCEWNDDLIDKACAALRLDAFVPPNAPGGMVKFRRTLVNSFFYKFYLRVKAQALGIDAIPPKERSALPEFTKPLMHAEQHYQVVDERRPVHLPLPHLSAKKQVTGEAIVRMQVSEQVS